MKKNYVIKSYTQLGSFVGTIPDAEFRGFSKSLTEGLGECSLIVGRKFDDISSVVTEGNHIEIWLSDKESVEVEPLHSIRIYQGEIKSITPVVDGNTEQIEVHLVGYGVRLGLDVLKSSTTTSLDTRSSGGLGTGGAQNVDIGSVVRAIIDRYIAETTGPKIAYTTTTIPTVGTNMQYTFIQKTYQEAIEKCLSVAPFGYYAFLGADGLFNFKTIGSTPTHKFVFGKHFSSFKFTRSIDRLRNVILIFDGNTTYKHYEDVESISKYGRRIERLTDPGIKASGTMDSIGAKFLAENKSAEVQFVCEILDNAGSDKEGYDIESIQPGDTCSFFNFSSSIGSLMRENMIITEVEYTPEKAVITVEPIKYGISDISERLKKQIQEEQTSNIPATYS